MKKISVFLLVLFICHTMSFAVTTRDTNVDIIDTGKDMYGKNSSRVDNQLIGINSSDKVSIDEGAVGTVFGGAIDSGGDLSASTFIVTEKASAAVDLSATANGIITPIMSYQIIDTYLDAANASCNAIITANITIGTKVIFETSLASQDVEFDETGNIDLGATTRQLTDPLDKLILLKTGSDQWVEIGFYDNN